MSRYPIAVTREDGAQFLLVTGTDHASMKFGFRPHCFAQIFGQGVDIWNGEEDVEALLWYAEAITPEALVSGLNENPILRLGHFVGPHAPADYWQTHPAGDEGQEWLSEYAIAQFKRELEEMAS